MTMWVWAAWVLAIAVSFAVLEGIALMYHKPTFSRTVWTWSKNFPLLPFLAGLLAGGLAVQQVDAMIAELKQ